MNATFLLHPHSQLSPILQANIMRRHGWQRPLHPLQIVAIAIYSFLVMAFYTFLGLFLGNRVAEITVTTLFSFVVLSVMFLFIRCTAIDPTDKTSVRNKKKMESKSKSKSFSRINFGLMLRQIVLRRFRNIERKILKTFIRRKYLDPWKVGPQMEPLLPYLLVTKDDVITPDPKEEEDVTFCSLCNFEVKRHSKHCRTCNRCVEGFDHHCRWLNNCVGKKNYTTFFLLMIFVLLMLAIQGGTAIAIFVRCFADKKGMEMELQRRFHRDFPREALATISVLLVLLTAYGSAALGQLFFFHLVLIQKGMRTYDYILAMKEESQSIIEDPFDEDYSDFSSDDDFDSPEKTPTSVSRFGLCQGGRVKEDSTRLSIKIDANPQTPSTGKQGLRISINPWKLITLSRDKALAAAEKAKEKLEKSKQDYLKPLPLETKSGLLTDTITTSTGNCDDIDGRGSWGNANSSCDGVLPKAKGKIPSGSPESFSSPRRRSSSSLNTVPASVAWAASISPKHNKYRRNFDLKLTQVSKELETYISRQVLCSIIKKEESVASPR
ncbi:protein S-acyltransferase 18-like [Cucurbita moschata]|uniref:S-acyltransferase n=1 Tax=Cucurbita moschata TaxID=3662 RepID=A0A6J1GZB7_CUCMO|nr:protein S-acyltransferase 18-like [Cucurbita moschata]